MQNNDFSYDLENDDLIVFDANSKSKGSVELGNVILDYNTKKELVGIQIMKASSFIRDLTNSKDIKEILSNLVSCRMDVKKNGKFLIIKLILACKDKTITPVISMPYMIDKSPSLIA